MSNSNYHFAGQKFNSTICIDVSQVDNGGAVPALFGPNAGADKQPVVAASTAPGNLAFSFAAGSVLDGYTLLTGDRILLKDQVLGVENGMYIVTSGTPTRSPDMPIGNHAAGAMVEVKAGTVNMGRVYICVSAYNADVVGTNALTFNVVTSPVAAPLTTVNDTNVTLVSGGSSSTALLNPASITAGWVGQLSPDRGGTGVNNGTSTLSLGGNTTLTGAFPFVGVLTAPTSVTFPPFGTLATTSGGTPLTAVNDANVTLTPGGASSTALLQPTSLTVGWAGLLSSARGGTGVNNGLSTLTLGGNTMFAGAFPFTGTLTAPTSITFPPSGVLATVSQTSGRLVNTQYFSVAGVGTYVRSAGTNTIIVELLGGGGGGGSTVATGGPDASAGGGGGAGGWARKTFVAPAPAITYTVGAGGAGGVGGGAGGVGGTTSWDLGPTLSGTGGQGGLPGTNSAGPSPDGIGGAGGVGSLGDINAAGAPGLWGFVVGSTNNTRSGAGGASVYGGGALSVIATHPGNPGTNYGGGGSGGSGGNSEPSQAGGVGNSGLIIVYEYT